MEGLGKRKIIRNWPSRRLASLSHSYTAALSNVLESCLDGGTRRNLFFCHFVDAATARAHADSSPGRQELLRRHSDFLHRKLPVSLLRPIRSARCFRYPTLTKCVPTRKYFSTPRRQTFPAPSSSSSSSSRTRYENLWLWRLQSSHAVNSILGNFTVTQRKRVHGIPGYFLS